MRKVASILALLSVLSAVQSQAQEWDMPNPQEMFPSEIATAKQQRATAIKNLLKTTGKFEEEFGKLAPPKTEIKEFQRDFEAAQQVLDQLEAGCRKNPECQKAEPKTRKARSAPPAAPDSVQGGGLSRF